MRKKNDTLLNTGAAPYGNRGTIAGVILASLIACAIFMSHLALLNYGHASTTALQAARETNNSRAQGGRYLYYVLKESQGFVLARARAGSSNQPLETPHTVASFGNGFGQSTADAIISLQISSDGHYLAIDGTRSDGELLWVFDTQHLALNLEPANVSGTFLHWLPGSSETFLYRPMFPRGPNAPLKGGIWNPGLWEINATTGSVTNIDIHTPSAFLVDAVPSPDGSQIIYSTSAGLGMGSDVWTMDVHGQHQTHLLQLAGNAQSIAGLFAWSPNGQTIAYERLADSPTPFLPASLWLMNRQGQAQHFLAQADGGHGFALVWSPDGQKVAFVARTNPSTSMADQSMQALKSAVEVVDISNQQVSTVASPAQTGVQINAAPTWNAASTQITFAAFNPLNPELGGTIHYWSVSTHPTETTPGVTQLSQPVTHVIALG